MVDYLAQQFLILPKEKIFSFLVELVLDLCSKLTELFRSM